MQIIDFVTGKSKLVGLIGNPIEHSASPQLHNTLYRNLNLPYIYIPLKIEAPDLQKAVEGLRVLGFLGFNVTVPYKKDIIKYIDGLSREAALMEAVNTVKITPEGAFGYNTDADGFMRAFVEETGSGFKDKKVILIGAGGAARAVAVKLAIENAREILIINRNQVKATELAGLINNNIAGVAHTIGTEVLKNSDIQGGYDIIINATTLGMHPDESSCPVGDNFAFDKRNIVCDVIYNPVKTKFLKLAEQKGCKTINGAGMLFYQGISAFEIWSGIKATEDIISDLHKSFMNYIKK